MASLVCVAALQSSDAEVRILLDHSAHLQLRRAGGTCLSLVLPGRLAIMDAALARMAWAAV
ncbi:MAG TPA: hypothetical protein VMX14_02460 [Anaerolineae bacterium]|nr:hypothetical protein [Anaerolineae bacterium]